MKRVVVVPGIMGSYLDAVFIGIRRQIWLSYTSIFAQGLSLLKLADDGVNPAPALPFLSVAVDGIETSYYRTLLLYLANHGYEVLPFPYDWRQSIVAAGGRLAYLLRQLPPSADPTYVLGHSMGGLVMTSAWDQLGDTGARQQVARWVTLGSPHYGTLAAARIFAHLDPSYRRVWALQYPGRIFTPRLIVPSLDEAIASWPAVYEMLPNGHFGPYKDEPETVSACFTPGSYASRNPYVSAGRMSAADAVLGAKGGTYPAAVWTSVQSGGFRTAFMLNAPPPLTDPADYAYTSDGDGQVWRLSTLLNGAKSVSIDGVRHFEYPYHPAILGALDGLFAGYDDSLPLTLSRSR